MITNTIIQISAAVLLTLGQLTTPTHTDKVLAAHEMSLAARYYPVQKENILLNLAYLNNRVKSKQDINWDELQKPFTLQFKLNPGETFAFHDDILPEYRGKVTKTTNTHFNYQEGYKSYGYLVGDGVCHLASLMYWVAKDAGLDALAPRNHNFMPIPGINREYGVAIYNNPTAPGSSAMQNLYITNNKDQAITFKFKYYNENLALSISQDQF